MGDGRRGTAGAEGEGLGGKPCTWVTVSCYNGSGTTFLKIFSGAFGS